VAIAFRRVQTQIAEADGQSAKVVAEGELVRLIWTPVVTGEVDWKFVF